MVDDHGLRTTLGLGAFTRIVDNEWIDVGRGAKDGFGHAVLRQRNRFARKPFEVAVFAHVDNRVGTLDVAQPDVKGEIIVRRREVGRVICVCRINVVAARGLHTHGGIAEFEDGEFEAIGCEEWIIFRRAPAGCDLLLHIEREGVEMLLVNVQRQRFAAFFVSAIREPIGWSSHDRFHQHVAIARRIFNAVARIG